MTLANSVPRLAFISTAVAPKIEFDRADVLPTIRRAWSSATVDDAEDALQTAVAELLTKGTSLTAANVVTRGRSRLISMKSRREAGNLSLDAFRESDDDAPVELAIEEVDFDARLMLSEATGDPILRERLRNVAAGASRALAPRGTACHQSRHSDETVKEVRRLRSDDSLTFRAIEDRTGVERSLAAQWCRGVGRLTPTTPGWTTARARQSVQAWSRRHGRPPTYEDGQRDPRLPSPGTADRLFGSWRAMLEATGHPSPYAGRRLAPWSSDEGRRVIRAFVHRTGRWPSRQDMITEPNLPSPATCGRLFGTQGAAKLKTVIGDV